MMDAVSLHHFVDTAVHSFAVSMNVILFAVILRKSQTTLRNYRGVLLLTCVNDLLFGICALLDQPMVFFDGKICVFVSNGFLKDAGPTTILVLHIAYCATAIMNFALLSIPFLYRYHHMNRGKISWKDIVKLCIIPSTISVAVYFTAYGLLKGDDEFQRKGLAMMQAMKWPVNGLRMESIFGFEVAEGQYRYLPQIALCSITVTYTYAAIIWSEIKVLTKVNVVGRHVDVKAHRLNNDLHKALIALAICPLFCVALLGFLLLVVFLQLNLGLLISVIYVLLSSVTVVNPLTTLYFVHPFRRCILGLLSCGHQEAAKGQLSSGIPSLPQNYVMRYTSY